MGCDIHIFTEKWNKKEQRWESFDFWEKNEYYDAAEAEEEGYIDTEWCACEFDDNRWYEKFSILSNGVRGEAEGPCASELGFPNDACVETAANFKAWDCDAHSPNHITVAKFRHLVAEWRLLKGSNSPLNEMHEALEAHIKRKLKWDHIIDSQDWEHIRLVYWFDN